MEAVIALGTNVSSLVQQQLIDARRCEDPPNEKYCCNKTDVIEAPTSTTTSTTTASTTPGELISNAVLSDLY